MPQLSPAHLHMLQFARDNSDQHLSDEPWNDQLWSNQLLSDQPWSDQLWNDQFSSD